MRPIVDWFRALFAWQVVGRTPGWLFRENGVTGDRTAQRRGGVWSPMSREWRDWLLASPGRAGIEDQDGREDARDPRPGFGL